MRRVFLRIALLKRILSCVIALSFFIPPGAALAASPVEIFLSSGQNYYNRGYYDDALYEYNKVLLLEPDNSQAKQAILEIKRRLGSCRYNVVNQALNDVELALMSGKSKPNVLATQAPRKTELPPLCPAPEQAAPKDIAHYVSIKGVAQLSAGVRSPDEVIWKEANGDLNERNYRILWTTTRHNTYDPAIFDRMRFDIDTKNLNEVDIDNLNVHANITVDPWSFTGKSDKFTLTGAGGDRAEFELKYWSNTGRTINEIVPTLTNGDAMALPEVKVVDNRTTATSVRTTFGNTFNLPSVKIRRAFMPVRELWLDARDNGVKWRLFPMAYQNQALSSDDPLGLSNHHTWWEESPWLADWKPGNLNRGAFPDDFAKGQWDDSLAFFTRDSDGLRLTALRGIAFGFDGIDTDIQATLASPKNLWADYSDFHTYASAVRIKRDLLYNLGVGATYTGHFGYDLDELDGVDNVISMDAKYEPFIGTNIIGQIAYDNATKDRSNKTFVSNKAGNAYLVSLVNRFPQDDIYTKDYFAIKKTGEETAYLKSRFTLARMEDGFDPTLASYRQTREDEFWSRHISFRKHPLFLYTGLNKPMNFDDIRIFGIGDGIDTGRDAIGWRLDGSTLFNGRDLTALASIVNVHHANTGSFIENISRLELEYPFTDKLLTRFLGIRHDKAKTTPNTDPFIYNSVLNEYLVNTSINGGEDPSLHTLSFGAEYKLSEIFAVNGVWEHTNDAQIATDEFPRGLFNSSSFTTLVEDGKIYRQPIPFLYSQQYFDLPPYATFDIYKAGFSIRPIPELEFYLDLAYNHNKKAGQIDDNMNHYGLEVAYVPDEKISFLFKYTFSRWLDMLELNASGREIYQWHNNFFFETRYHIDGSSEFIMDYGVGGLTPLGSSSYDPFGGALAVLDTQHIVRVYYKKNF